MNVQKQLKTTLTPIIFDTICICQNLIINDDNDIMKKSLKLLIDKFADIDNNILENEISQKTSINDMNQLLLTLTSESMGIVTIYKTIIIDILNNISIYQLRNINDRKISHNIRKMIRVNINNYTPTQSHEETLDDDEYA